MNNLYIFSDINEQISIHKQVTIEFIPEIVKNWEIIVESKFECKTGITTVQVNQY